MTTVLKKLQPQSAHECTIYIAKMPPSVVSITSTLSSLAGVHDAFQWKVSYEEIEKLQN